jgi:hypothetical protein
MLFAGLVASSDCSSRGKKTVTLRETHSYVMSDS